MFYILVGLCLYLGLLKSHCTRLLLNKLIYKTWIGLNVMVLKAILHASVLCEHAHYFYFLSCGESRL